MHRWRSHSTPSHMWSGRWASRSPRRWNQPSVAAPVAASPRAERLFASKPQVRKWGGLDSDQRPTDYESVPSSALTCEDV
jgi:hypothetical protein